MQTRLTVLVACALLLPSSACRTLSRCSSGLDASLAASACLDDLHRLASEADGEAYFALFASDAVYLGTDASERWTIEEFRAYAKPHFSKGRGWTYRVRERHLVVSEDQRTVWFDERLDNDSYGECRGSGVLVERDGRFLIAQYVLSLPVPNSLARDLVERIRALEASSGAEGPGGGL